MHSTPTSQIFPLEDAHEPIVGCHDSRRPLASVAQLVERHPCLTAGGVRADIFGATARQSSKGMMPGNGLAPAIVRKGRRVLLDEIGYLTWVRTGRVDQYLQVGQSVSMIAGAPK